MASRIGGICTSSSAYMPCGLPVHVHSPCSLNRLGGAVYLHYGLTSVGHGCVNAYRRSLPVSPLPGLCTSHTQMPCGPACRGRSSLPYCYT